MSPKVVRVLAMGVFFVIGIPGMIVASITDNSGAAVTFGLIAVAAALALLAVTAVTTPRIPPDVVSSAGSTPFDEAEAEALEQQVRSLVTSGTDEAQLRELVRSAVRMSRRTPA